MEIEGILFDFGGTLDSDGVYWYDRFYSICSAQGMDLTRDEFETIAQTAGKRISEHSDIKQLSHEGTVLRLFEEIGKISENRYYIDPLLASDTFLDFCRPTLKRNLKLIKLFAEQFSIGVLSNNWGNANGWCEQYGYLPYLDTVVDSGQEGVSKPNPKIFNIALKALNLQAHQVAYVGDRFHTDMVGAKQVGMLTVWIRSAENNEKMEDGIVDHTIQTLQDLLLITKSHWNIERGI